MRTRNRLLLVMLSVYAALALLTGIVSWSWLDRLLLEQAEDRARIVAGLGNYLSSDDIRAEIERLTGYRIELVADGVDVGAGVLVVEDRYGRPLAIDYRNAAYHRLRRLVFYGTIGLLCAGGLVYAVAAWALARSFARPIERLTASVEAIGAGRWQQPVPAVGGGELRDLAGDIDGMRQALLALDAERRRDERLRTIGTFTATIAHEVRNPLSAVQLSLQLLARRLPDEASLQRARQELQRLDLIVDELLAFSGGMTIERFDCRLEELVDQVFTLLQRQAEHAGVTLERRGVAQVVADPARLQQILLNLILNAIQAQHGGGAVLVTVTDDGFIVADEGPGVDPTIADRLFDPFATDKPAGTGLGLHIAQTIAEAHDAALCYEPGAAGARFRLSGLRPAVATDRGPPQGDRPCR